MSTWNADSQMISIGLTISTVSSSSVVSEYLTFNLQVASPSLSPSEVDTVCKAIQRELDADFAQATKCWKYECKLTKKRQGTSVTVGLSQPPSNSGVPIWIIVVAVIGGLLLLIAIIIIIYFIIHSSKKEKFAWEKY